MAVQFRGAFDSRATRFEVVSDPFCEAGGIAVRVTTKKDPHSCTADSGDSASECKRTETTLALRPSIVEQEKHPWTNRRIKIGARERWSRTSRIKVAILACEVNGAPR